MVDKIPSLGKPGQVDEPEELEPEEDLTADDVALVAFQGLLASGQYITDPGAAAELAWNVCVPAFMFARGRFPQFMERLYGNNSIVEQDVRQPEHSAFEKPADE